MPTVNFYFKDDRTNKLEKLIPDLKQFLAAKLTCVNIKLTSREISIRLIKISGGQMIGNTEIEISAHSFPERVKKQDEICIEVVNYLKEKAPYIGKVKVWLKLSELGHSWQ